MKKSEYYFTSSNGVNQIHTILWEPEEVRAILQISHGMAEYIERYEPFAEFMTKHGILVVGNDHMGHGKSVKAAADRGYFAKENASEKVVEDLHEVTLRTRQEYPDLPYFLLGHSMGSFMARRYLMTYGEELNGALILGTGNQPDYVIAAGKISVKLISLIKGEHYRSKLVEEGSFAGYNKRFLPANTGLEWLSRNSENLDAYRKDEACGFIFTLNGYKTIFETLTYIKNKQNIQNIPKNLPIVFLSGAEDPVGNYGKAVNALYHQYRFSGIQDVKIKLYKDDRHEILNETDRPQVYHDILKWMRKHME